MSDNKAKAPASAGALPVPDDERMTDAEFKVVREYLGLTTRWVADHLGVAERSVHRWEAGVSPIPDGVRIQMERWEDDTARSVVAGVVALMDVPEPAVVTYRTDADYQRAEPGAEWPASWHRAVVARVAAAVPGLLIVYRQP